MKNTRRNVVLCLVGYTLLLLMEGMIRNHMISNLIPEDLQSISNVVNGFSLFFSTLWMVIIILLSMIFTLLYIALFDVKIKYSSLLEAWENLLIIDIMFGIGKFSLLWIVLKDDLLELKISNSISQDLLDLPYAVICSYIDCITIYVSAMAFGISLYVSDKKNLIHSSILAALLLTMMLLLYYKII